MPNRMVNFYPSLTGELLIILPLSFPKEMSPFGSRPKSVITFTLTGERNIKKSEAIGEKVSLLTSIF